MRLPWGYGLEMSLENVEMASGVIPGGGKRVGYTPREGVPGAAGSTTRR